MLVEPHPDTVLPGADIGVVAVDELTVGYRSDEPVLHDVSIDVAAGETLSLLGPSGCGKTTLLRAIAGLQQPSGGRIRIGDRMVDGPGVHVEPHRRQVGMVFQNGALFPHLTVAENVAFGLRGHADPVGRTDEMLALVELSDLALRLPDSLSGGQRQRVALARALAPNPSVLLLDEPFSALDAGMRNQIRRDVKDILRQIGITTIVVTHDQDEAFVFGDRVALMRAGRLVQVGASTELYDRPRNRWVADFVGEVNVVPGHLAAGHGAVVTPFGKHEPVVVTGDDPRAEVDAAAEMAVDVLIRPEQLEVGVDEGQFQADGVVHSAEYFGHDVLYHVHSDEMELLVRTTDSTYRPGDKVLVGYVGRRVVVWTKPD